MFKSSYVICILFTKRTFLMGVLIERMYTCLASVFPYIIATKEMFDGAFLMERTQRGLTPVFFNIISKEKGFDILCVCFYRRDKLPSSSEFFCQKIS